MTSTAVRRASSLIAVSTLWAENSSMFAARPRGKRIVVHKYSIIPGRVAQQQQLDTADGRGTMVS